MGEDSRRKGLFGEYLVLSQLVRYPKPGYEAWKTSDNTKDVDIVATNPQNQKVAFIQVKTTAYQRKNLHWDVSRRAFDWKGERRFYVFVDLRNEAQTDFYVVPSETVSRVSWESHRKWCEAHHPPKDPKNYTGRPGFYLAGHPEVKKYGVSAPKAEDVKGRWDSLGLE